MATNNAVNTSLSGQSGTGSFAGTTSPTFVTPVLGTPTSGNLSNCTAYPVASLSGLGAGVATFLATPSSANLATALTDETGSGLAVFNNAPTLIAPVLGAASATSLAFSSTSGIIGTTTNNNAAAGSVGEYLVSAISGTVNFTTTNVAQNIQSISLTAGDWDVHGSSLIQNGSTVTGGPSMSLSSTSATQGSQGMGRVDCNLTNALTGLTFLVYNRISLASTTTIYLVGQAGWTGTAALYNAAQIVARRVR